MNVKGKDFKLKKNEKYWKQKRWENELVDKEREIEIRIGGKWQKLL